MSGQPADHPAVAGPKAAAATGNLLAAPSAQPRVTGNPIAPTPNDPMLLLRDLHPGGGMNHVVIKKLSVNKNLIATGTMSGQKYGAWTQSASLIYVRNDLFNISDITLAYVLKHESEHILQFGKNSTPPSSFQHMLDFEVGAYSRTYEWIKGKRGIHDLTQAGWEPLGADMDEYDMVVEIAKGAADGVLQLFAMTLMKRAGRFAQRLASGVVEVINPQFAATLKPGTTDKDFHFDNMAGSDMIPAAKPKLDSQGAPLLDPAGDPIPLRYQAKDMYLVPKDADFAKRMKTLGWGRQQ